VAALDSLVVEPTLRSLGVQGRLKTCDNPVALMPGEAGAALLISREPESHPAVAPVWRHAVALGQEPYPRGTDRPAEGHALARCALEVQEAAAARGERPLLLGDHNGEELRGWEWGMLLLHLRSQSLKWAGLRT
jgi:3-oxoacyl-[acyl-carrier-protein] synthase I